MAFAAGPVSFQRFAIDGSIHDEVTDKLVEALASRAFGKALLRSDDTQVGWIGPGHLFETEIAAERIAFGQFVHLALRIDRLKVPANVVKAYVRMEEEAALQAGGRAFLSRGEKRRARETALVRAEKDLRSGAFRRLNSYPVLIDLAHGCVFLGGGSKTVADALGQLFADTFGRGLAPLDAERVAAGIAQRAGKTRALEGLEPLTLVPPPAGFEGAGREFESDLNFLGRELLTWLWYQTEADAGALRVRSGDDVTVMIDRTVRLKCDFGLTGTDVISADNPTSLPEAKAALRIGKQPTRLGLVVGCPLGEFRFTLDGERLAVSGLALPEDDAEQDPRARLEQRFELTADAANLIDAMFELYLRRRISRGWENELREMSAWAAGRSGKSARARIAT